MRQEDNGTAHQASQQAPVTAEPSVAGLEARRAFVALMTETVPFVQSEASRAYIAAGFAAAAKQVEGGISVLDIARLRFDPDSRVAMLPAATKTPASPLKPGAVDYVYFDTETTSLDGVETDRYAAACNSREKPPAKPAHTARSTPAYNMQGTGPTGGWAGQANGTPKNSAQAADEQRHYWREGMRSVINANLR